MSDVPGEVYAALCEAAGLAPVGPAPADPAARIRWWEQHAGSDEAALQAFHRLHAWSVDAEQPAAVTAAIGVAVTAQRREADRCRREAERVRGR